MQIMKLGVYETNAYPWVERPLSRASPEAEFIFRSLVNIFLLNEQNTNYSFFFTTL